MHDGCLTLIDEIKVGGEELLVVTKENMAKAIIVTEQGNVDISAHLACMFDALVGSMDWGSDFLESEEIDAILAVAELMGYDLPLPSDRTDNLQAAGFTEPHPDAGRWADFDEQGRIQWAKEYDAWKERKKAAMTKWVKHRAAEAVQRLRDEQEDHCG